MAINLEKKRILNNCIVPLFVTLMIIGVVMIVIDFVWGAIGYVWILRIIGVICGFIAFCGLCSKSKGGCLLMAVCGILAALCIWGGNSIKKAYIKSMPIEDITYNDSSESSLTPKFDDESEEFGLTEEDSLFFDNRLQTGVSPYKSVKLSGSGSTIEVKTTAGDENDVVVIIKHNGKIVRNAYIQGGDSYQFFIPNGTYQVFSYGGKGWNPDKKMTGGYSGGFVTNESFSKDNAVTLDYQGLNYELILQRNGNFSTEQSSKTEMF